MYFPEVETYFTTDMRVCLKSSSKPFLLKVSKSIHGTNVFLLLGLDMFSCEPAIDIKHRRLCEGTRDVFRKLNQIILFYTCTLSKERTRVSYNLRALEVLFVG
jgi:hypothetical protein